MLSTAVFSVQVSCKGANVTFDCLFARAKLYHDGDLSLVAAHTCYTMTFIMVIQ